MKTLLLALLGLTAHNQPGSNQVSASITFTGTIVPGAEIAIQDHYLGDGVTSYVATYSESHTQEMRHETVEILAMEGDSIDFKAEDKTLVARRFRHDRWPTRINAYAYKGSAAHPNRD